jgi:hypothetical protein
MPLARHNARFQVLSSFLFSSEGALSSSGVVATSEEFSIVINHTRSKQTEKGE